MPSPFPGMNPYLEQPHLWREVHTRLLAGLGTAINAQVSPRYRAYLDEAVYIDELDEERLVGLADVAISGRPPRRRRSAEGAAVTIAAPASALIPDGMQKNRRWLTIRDTRDRTVVTVIELLSPSNKTAGDDGARYRAKRRKVLRSKASFIEIDLLRGGRRMPLDRLPECAYYAMVSRPADRPEVGLWPLQLRDPLPAIPIPLRSGEPEPLIPLKPVLDRVYDEGVYETIIYDAQPDPPLSAADAEWAKQFLPPT